MFPRSLGSLDPHDFGQKVSNKELLQGLSYGSCLFGALLRARGLVLC